jgi:chromosomal replication initiator protein
VSTTISFASTAGGQAQPSEGGGDRASAENGALWARILARLERHPAVSRANFSAWLRHTQLLERRGDVYIVGARHRFARDKLEHGFREVLEEALRECAGQSGARVEFSLTGSSDQTRSSLLSSGPSEPSAPVLHRSPPAPVSVPAPDPPREPGIPTAGLHPRYTFSTFVVGKETQFAYAAARSVAENPGFAYNPLVIFGGPGLGKTHLLQAIGQHALALNRSIRVAYFSAHTLLPSGQDPQKATKGVESVAKYANVDILLLDDVQLLAGRPVLEDLLHLLRIVEAEDKQVVFAVDRPVREIQGLDDRLRSRLQTGLMAHLSPPGWESRLAILRAKAEARGATLPAPVLEHIAHRVTGGVRELESALLRVVAAAELGRGPLTIDGVTATLASVPAGRPRVRPTLEHVLHAVAAAFGTQTSELVGKRRDKETALARQVAMYLMREETSVSLSEIGDFLGGRDHSTVSHGYEKISHSLRRDERLLAHVEAARHLIHEAAPLRAAGGRTLDSHRP